MGHGKTVEIPISRGGVSCHGPRRRGQAALSWEEDQVSEQLTSSQTLPPVLPSLELTAASGGILSGWRQLGNAPPPSRPFRSGWEVEVVVGVWGRGLAERVACRQAGSPPSKTARMANRVSASAREASGLWPRRLGGRNHSPPNFPQNSPSIFNRRAYPPAWKDGLQPHTSLVRQIRHAAQKPRLGVFGEWPCLSVRELPQMPEAALEITPYAYAFHAGYPSLAVTGSHRRRGRIESLRLRGERWG